jgi:methionyl aminopeptidase
MTNAATETRTGTATSATRSWWVRLDTGAAERLSGRPADERRGPSAPRRAGVAEIRTPAEIELMAEAGRVAALALRAASAACVPGATTAAVDGAASGVIAAERCEPAFLGLRASPEAPAFPAATCVSVNEQVVHGVPGERRLADGDVVKIDCGVRCRGWCADAAVTVVVGQAGDDRFAMVARARAMLDEAIAMIVPGRRWSEIAERLQCMALEGGYGLLTDLIGHGIGRSLHEWPEAPNSLSRSLLTRRDFTLLPGMTLAIEPMLAMVGGQPVRRDQDGHPMGVATRVAADGWTVEALSGLPSAHFEHTVAVTGHGARVLTRLAQEIR